MCEQLKISTSAQALFFWKLWEKALQEARGMQLELNFTVLVTALWNFSEVSKQAAVVQSVTFFLAHEIQFVPSRRMGCPKKACKAHQGQWSLFLHSATDLDGQSRFFSCSYRKIADFLEMSS